MRQPHESEDGRRNQYDEREGSRARRLLQEAQGDVATGEEARHRDPQHGIVREAGEEAEIGGQQHGPAPPQRTRQIEQQRRYQGEDEEGKRGNKTFKWQFGSTVTAYAAITPVSSNLAYSIVTILNDPGSQTSQTMFLDTLVVGSANPTFGLTSNPAQNTSGAQSLTFLFNAANTETITPKGFVVEAIE